MLATTSFATGYLIFIRRDVRENPHGSVRGLSVIVECEMHAWVELAKTLGARAHVKRIGVGFGNKSCLLGSTGSQDDDRAEQNDNRSGPEVGSDRYQIISERSCGEQDNS